MCCVHTTTPGRSAHRNFCTWQCAAVQQWALQQMQHTFLLLSTQPCSGHAHLMLSAAAHPPSPPFQAASSSINTCGPTPRLQAGTSAAIVARALRTPHTTSSCSHYEPHKHRAQLYLAMNYPAAAQLLPASSCLCTQPLKRRSPLLLALPHLPFCASLLLPLHPFLPPK